MLLSFLMITLADTALHAQVGSNILLKTQRKHHNIFKHNTEHKEFTLINKHNKNVYSFLVWKNAIDASLILIGHSSSYVHLIQHTWPRIFN